ncbi:MAG: hypothetical protein WB439_00720 [Acidobacteriaceae bacterium]
MKLTTLKWMVLASVLLPSLSYANAACSNGTLHGRYAFTLTGQILAPAPSVGAVSGVALTTFYGDGSLSQVDHVVHNGVLPVEEWRPAVGSYSINSDCTGWMTIEPRPTEASDGSPELKLYIVVSEDGREIRTVVSGSPNAPPFAAVITSIGTRLEESVRGNW